MRIFYAVGSRPHGILAESSVWRINLFQPLVALGHDVIEFDFDLDPHYRHADPAATGARDFISERRPVLEAALLRQVTRAHEEEPIDMFFSYFYSAFVRSEVIQAINDMGIVSVNWYCNASYQFNLVRDIAPAYSYCLVPERFRLRDYRDEGATPIYCQEAANPDYYGPRDVPLEYDVSFVGAAYGTRPSYMRDLAAASVDAHAWGPGWKDMAMPSSRALRLRQAGSHLGRRMLGRPQRPPSLPAEVCGGLLSDSEMVSMFSRSRISLGFSGVVDAGSGCDAPIRQVRLRDFEVPMSGGFYLLEYLDEIEDFFVPGEEIAVFEGSRDLVAKARYYLSHEDEREGIRSAGRARAIRDHTWQKRLTDAFGEMSLVREP